MVTKAKKGTMAKLLLALTMVCAACSVAPAQAANPQPVVGRYQIVNPTALARTVMLLDTATGNSWLACVDEKGISWCDMARGGVQSGHIQLPGEQEVK